MENKEWNDLEDRYVLYMDIMGFKERVSRIPTEKLKKDLLGFKESLIKLDPLLHGIISPALPEKKQLLKISQFSDSIVVVSRSNTINDLNRICKIAVILMHNAMKSQFALRGSISMGQMVYDENNQLFFGKALVDAYLLEEQLAFYGIVFHESAEIGVNKALSGPKQNNKYFPIKDEEIMTKGGKSQHYHVAWYLMDEKLSKKDISDVALSWLKELRTTVSGNARVYLDNTRRIIEQNK